jgi:hypothetical protein
VELVISKYVPHVVNQATEIQRQSKLRTGSTLCRFKLLADLGLQKYGIGRMDRKTTHIDLVRIDTIHSIYSVSVSFITNLPLTSVLLVLRRITVALSKVV